jgi:hypothetical protein
LFIVIAEVFTPGVLVLTIYRAALAPVDAEADETVQGFDAIPATAVTLDVPEIASAELRT